MARTDSLTNFLTDVANSIRNKKGTTDTILASDFDTEIESIETGGGEANLQSKSITITENGTQIVTPDTDYDGLSSVEVTTNVPTSSEIFTISNCTGLFASNCRNDVMNKLLPHCNGTTNCYRMFNQSSNLTELDLSSFDTSNVTSMYQMFANCSSLKRLDISNFDMSKVTTMQNMFASCSSLTTLILPNLNNSVVTDIQAMFYNMRSLAGELDLSGWNMNKVTNARNTFSNNWCSSISTPQLSAITDTYGMFSSCIYAKTINCSKMNTSKVTSMQNMFYGCSALTELDLSNFDTSKVTSMQSMFYGCSALTSLNLSNFDTSKVTNMSSMFHNCSKLTSLDLSSFDFAKVTSFTNMFTNCGTSTSTGLTTVYVKDETAQNWILTKSNGRPSTWTTENVVIKEI